MSTTLIPLDGTFNCRDLGGYQTEDGRLVKRGKLIRSDALHKLTEQDLAVLQDMGIDVIVDFRAQEETQAQPNRVPQGARLMGMPPIASMASVAAAASADVVKGDAARLAKMDAMASTEEGRAWLQKSMDSLEVQMRELVTSEASIAAYGRFLRLLAQPDTGPVMFNCKGGKDRTGWAAALILSVLGVPREVVMEDYMTTERYNRTRNEKRMAEYSQLTSNALVLEFLSSIMQVKPAYLNAAFEEVDKRSGIESYLAEALHVSRAEQAQLREKYLEMK